MKLLLLFNETMDKKAGYEAVCSPLPINAHVAHFELFIALHMQIKQLRLFSLAKVLYYTTRRSSPYFPCIGKKRGNVGVEGFRPRFVESGGMWLGAISSRLQMRGRFEARDLEASTSR
jgi:hypothetical protein